MTVLSLCVREQIAYCWELQIGWWQVRRWTVGGLTTSEHLVLLWHFTSWWIEVVWVLSQSTPIVPDCCGTLGMASGPEEPASWHDPGWALCLHPINMLFCVMAAASSAEEYPTVQRYVEVVQGLQQQGEWCLLGDAVCLSEEPFQMVKLWMYLNHCSSQKHLARGSGILKSQGGQWIPLSSWMHRNNLFRLVQYVKVIN